jgi:esterase/lipase
LYFVYPVGIGLFVTFKFNKSVGAAPDGFKIFELETSDNVKLSTWYKEPENGAVIIVLHGSTDSRESVRNHIKILADEGYGVLAFDMRGHGESTGDGVVAYNWDGTKDVQAAVDYLIGQQQYNIGALGLSLGGEVLLGAASDVKFIKAIVSEGATERSTKDYIALKENKSFVRSYFTRLMYSSAKLFSDVKEPVPIVDSIIDSPNTKFMFIAAGKINKEIKYNKYFHSLVKDRSELWIVKNSGHIKGISTDKDEYTKKIINFYNNNLLSAEV